MVYIGNKDTPMRLKMALFEKEPLPKLRGIGYTRKASSKRKKKPTTKFFVNPF